MNNRIINHLSYEATLKNLLEYDEKHTNELCDSLKFPKLVSTRFIALRKNVEIGFVASNLTKWEQQNLDKYGKNHIYQEYYPAIFDLAKKVSIPRKVEFYGCNIDYYYLFPPTFYKNMIYSFFGIFFAKPIFKKFHSHQNSLELKLTGEVSTFFSRQNRYGPEHISVAILDNQFITIMISGLLTPFFEYMIHTDSEEACFIENMLVLQAKTVLEQILNKYFNTAIDNPFIYFDKKADKLIILSHLSQEEWVKFLDAMSV